MCRRSYRQVSDRVIPGLQAHIRGRAIVMDIQFKRYTIKWKAMCLHRILWSINIHTRILRVHTTIIITLIYCQARNKMEWKSAPPPYQSIKPFHSYNLYMTQYTEIVIKHNAKTISLVHIRQCIQLYVQTVFQAAPNTRPIIIEPTGIYPSKLRDYWAYQTVTTQRIPSSRHTKPPTFVPLQL